MLPDIRYVIAIALLSLTVQDTIAFGRDRSDKVLPPFGHTHFCLLYPIECRQTPSRREFRVTREKLDELEAVNNSVNQEIQPAERQPDGNDRWLIDPPSGDCTDYAVTKRHVLLQKGWPAERLLLAEVELANGEHHLILLVRTTTTAWVLDNLRSDVPEINQVRGDYIWVKIETPENPKSWTRSFRILGS
jgi:predicted transglutaminase-like cysteine proteinase